MYDFNRFINKYMFIDYSPAHNFLYSMVSKVEDGELYLIVSTDFERAGLLIDDILRCKIQENDIEYSFKARITGVDIRSEGLTLIVSPVTEVEQYINVRAAKRINLRVLAMTDGNNPASVLNVSKRGMLIATKKSYKKNQNVDMKLLISYPSKICSFSGDIIRIMESDDDRKEYGIAIKSFNSKEDEEKYDDFINDLLGAFKFTQKAD